MPEPTNKRIKQRALAVLLSTLFTSQQVALAGPGATLPSGGTFAAGTGAISTSSNTVSIQQTSLRGIINWDQFSIGAGGTVNFRNGTGATLNRVTGGSMSSILGNLVATGSVYLINPNGVLIGPKGTVNTGGDFVASALDISNNLFLKGGSLIFASGSGAVVKNLGQVYSKTGSVFLIARSVENNGSLSAPNGTVGLAAGQSVLLKDSSSDERIFVQLAGGDSTNRGSISSAEAELKAVGGNIYALAGNDGGQIRAKGTATRGGHIWIVADGGQTTVAGQLRAENANGTGGQIETSGAQVSVGGADIKTGRGGSWLLDPVDLTIDSPAASVIESSLNAGTNVTEQTSASASSGAGVATSGNGDITVASNIAWNSGASLTLTAYRDVTVANGVTLSNSGAGSLTLRADNAAAGHGTVNFIGTGAVDFSQSTGDVSLYYHPAAFPAATDYTQNITMGTGTMTAFMTVDNFADFQNVNNNLAGNYALNTDLDSSSVTSFTPVGNDPDSFSGIFDGQNHVVRNLTINDSSDANVGLFGFVANTGVVKNLSLLNEQITSTSANVGGLVGTNWGSIVNSSAAGSITNASASNSQIGGLVGWNYTGATIRGSFADMTVTGADSNYLGGLTGVNDYGATVQDSYAIGPVHGGTFSNIGGLIGYNDGIVTTSYATGAVNATGQAFVGAVVGFNELDQASANNTWNVDTAGTTSAVGNGSFTGFTGQTTNQLKGGTLPANFDPQQWVAVAGHYPVLAGQTTVVSGMVQSNGSAVTSATVAGIAGGTVFDTAATNANGFYQLLLPRGAMSKDTGVLTSVSAGGTGNTFSDGGATGSFTGMDLAANSLQLLSSNIRTYSGMLAALGLTAGGVSGNGLRFQVGNVTLNLIGNTGLSVLATGAPFLLDGTLSANGPISVKATSGVTLAEGSHITGNSSGDALVLASGGKFINDAGTNPFTVGDGGRWLVYSQNPTGDSLGGLNYGFKQYNKSLGSSVPVANGGNGLLYSYAPVLTVALTGTTTKTYDGSAAASLVSSNFGVTGISGTDSVVVNPGASVYANKNAGVGKQVNATGFTLTASNGAAPVYGYQLSSQTASGSIGTIMSAEITASLSANNKVYDGTTSATGSIGALSGVVAGDTVGVNATRATYTFANKNAGTSSVSQAGVVLSGADAGNYKLAVENGSATISPAELTASIAANSKTYDGTVAATGSIGSLRQVVGGDAVSVDTSNAKYLFADKNTGAHPVSVTGAVLSGADAGNYTLAVSDGLANITPAILTYTSDPVSRQYGADNPVFQGSVTGFMPGESTATSTTGALTFSTTATVQSAAGAYGIKGSGLVANHDNYTFVQAAPNSSALTINPLPGVLTIVVNGATRFTGQPNPQFTATYQGPVVSGLDVNSILANLTFDTSATSASGAGTYQISATPKGLPSQFSVAIVPGRLLVIDDSPKTLPTQVSQPVNAPASVAQQSTAFAPTLVAIPSIFHVATGSAVPANTLGAFDVSFSPKWSSVQSSPSAFGTAISTSSFTPNTGFAPNAGMAPNAASGPNAGPVPNASTETNTGAPPK